MRLLKISIDSICNVGSVRTNNEDIISLDGLIYRDNSFQIYLEPEISNNRFLISVSDGMGGHNAGEVASEIVVSELQQFKQELANELPADADELKSLFQKKVKEIHKKLTDEGKRDSNKHGMGATFISVLFLDNRVFYFSAGDSRLYRFRRGILRQISKDHSLAELIGDARSKSHIILNSVGGGESVFIDFIEITEQLLDEDILLLCSDGLTDMLSDDTIESQLEKNITAADLCNLAKEAGGKDNISIALLKLQIESEDD
ncbi:MAG: serine/threonine-protein phosphatase [Ignavibacteriaceae bacterium]|nr:serine/threonine-protein phosphatase [Ignavibacteriaceae bacterium]